MNITIGGLYKNPKFGYQCWLPDGSMFVIQANEPFVIIEVVKVKANNVDDRIICKVLSTQGEISNRVFLNAGDLEEVKE